VLHSKGKDRKKKRITKELKERERERELDGWTDGQVGGGKSNCVGVQEVQIRERNVDTEHVP
jgi:hypothetical protein